MTEEWPFTQKHCQTSAFPFVSVCRLPFPSKSLGRGRHSFMMHRNLTTVHYFPLQQPVRNRTHTLTLSLYWKLLIWGWDNHFSNACRDISPQPCHCPSQTFPARIQHKATLAALSFICGPQSLFWESASFLKIWEKDIWRAKAHIKTERLFREHIQVIASFIEGDSIIRSESWLSKLERTDL